MVEARAGRQVRRRHDAGRHYFVANQGTNTVDGWVALGTAAQSAVLMDPMSGRTGWAETRGEGGRLEARLRIEPGASLILRSFEFGADGVILLECTDEDCRYGPGPEVGHGNVQRVRRLLHLLGIRQERLVECTFAAHETERLVATVRGFAADIAAMGPVWGTGMPPRAVEVP